MTVLARSRLNAALALAIPTAGFWYLMSAGLQTTSLLAVSVMAGVGVIWLAAVVTLNALPIAVRGRDVRDVTKDPAPAPRASPDYVVDVSRTVKPWRWTSVLLAPLELLAVAWGAPVLILLIMLPVGLALVGVLWVGRFLVQVF